MRKFIVKAIIYIYSLCLFLSPTPVMASDIYPPETLSALADMYEDIPEEFLEEFQDLANEATDLIPFTTDEAILRRTKIAFTENAASFVINVAETPYRLELVYSQEAGTPTVTLIGTTGEIIASNAPASKGIFKKPVTTEKDIAIYVLDLLDDSVGKWSCTVTFENTPDIFCALETTFTENGNAEAAIDSQVPTELCAWCMTDETELIALLSDIDFNNIINVEEEEQTPQTENTASRLFNLLMQFKQLLLIPLALIVYLMYKVHVKRKAKRQGTAPNAIRDDKKKKAEERRIREIEEMRAVLAAHDDEYTDDEYEATLRATSATPDKEPEPETEDTYDYIPKIESNKVVPSIPERPVEYKKPEVKTPVAVKPVTKTSRVSDWATSGDDELF